MEEDKRIYYLLVFMFIIFIGVFIAFFIIKNMNVIGKVQIDKKYSNIVYDLKSTELSLNKETICVRFSKIKNEVYFDIYNTGNEDVRVSNVNINNFNTNLDKDKIDIKLNVNVGDIIKGGEIKRVIINTSYNDLTNENDYLNYDIKYSFN